MMLKLFLTHIFTSSLLLFFVVGLPVLSVSELVSSILKVEIAEVVPSLKKVGVARKPAIVTVEESFDFTPRFIEQVNGTEEVEEKIAFKEIAKPHFSKIVKLKEKVVPSLKSNKIKSEQLLEKNVYELSFKDIEEEQSLEANKVQKVAWVSFRLPRENIVKKEIRKPQDRISTVAAATEKSSSSDKKSPSNKRLISEVTPKVDELVFFNYSEDGKVRAEEVIVNDGPNTIESPSAGISKSGANLAGLSGIMNMPPRVNIQKAEKKPVSAKLKRSKGLRVAKADNPPPPTEKLEDQFFNKSSEWTLDMEKEDYSCLNQSLLKRSIFENEYSISLNSISLNTQDLNTVHNFEIRFQDDIDDIAQDFGEGEINLNYKLSSKMNIRRGTILVHGHYPTTMDFVFEGGSARYSIPVFEKDKFNSLVNELDVPALGAHLLVELDDMTEDVELDIDTKYDAKVFLDKSFNRIDRNTSEYVYIMFVGVNAGNTIINFKDRRHRVTNKIVHLSAKEIYYEPNFYAQVSSDNIAFFEEGLRTKCPGLLNIEANDIRAWSFEGKITKKSLNTYRIEKMLYPLGTRKYFELNHLEKSLYVGKWSEEEIVVPDAEYADNILNNFDVAAGECLVQLNVTKSIKQLHHNGMDANGHSQVWVRFLDQDGSFYENVSDKTNRIFIHGERQGIINIKLDYTDGSSQFIQTYCSGDTYLVEQL